MAIWGMVYMTNSEQSAYSKKKAGLIKLIKDAFSGVPKPEITLRVARAHDDYHYPKTPEELARLRRDNDYDRWEEIPDEDIATYWDVCPFFDQQARCFYLPAFMVWCVRHPDGCTEEGNDVGLSVVFDLRHHLDELKEMTVDQRVAIREFLLFVIRHYEIGNWQETRELLQRLDEMVEKEY